MRQVLIATLIAMAVMACQSKVRFVTGVKGEPGDSCHIEQLDNGSIITCPDGSNAVINDGIDGVDGGGFLDVTLIKPCDGEQVVLRLGDGTLLGHYSHGVRQYLAILGVGLHETTDGSKCAYEVHSNGSVTW